MNQTRVKCPHCYKKTIVRYPDEGEYVSDFARQRGHLRGDPGHKHDEVKCKECRADFWIAYSIDN